MSSKTMNKPRRKKKVRTNNNNIQHMRGEPTIKTVSHPRKHVSVLDIYDFDAMKIHLSSRDEIMEWSFGEVTKPETINYRTQRPEKDGLFSERIFGPTKDYECYCGKYKKIRYKGVICDRCGVEVTKSIVRRERMAHITLAAPCAHIWFLRGVPSRIGLLLDIPLAQLERVVYYTGYIVTRVDEDAKKQVMKELEQEVASKRKAIKKQDKQKMKQESESLEQSFDKAKMEITSIIPKKVITELEYQHLAMRYGHVFEAHAGSEPLVAMLEGLDLKKMFRALVKELQDGKVQTRKKVLQRMKLVKSFINSGVSPCSMFFTALPVLPPDLRPMVQLDGGRYASSDLNDLYRRIINRNNRLKRLIELNSPEVIIRNEKRMLQEAVDALVDNSSRRSQGVQQVAMSLSRRPLRSLADILKGKQGRFRQNLLGKRVDYSGRSVIVIGPELKLYQCGIPKKMALELFKPFVIHELINRELAYNIKLASHMVDDQHPVVWDILDQVVSGKFVLLNRAPTLHRLSVQAFQPVLIEGLSIRIHPMVCVAFNADFDGDQMAVHLPLSEEAQDEARTIMLSSLNLLKPASGEPVIEPTKDIVLGLYWLTRLSIEPAKLRVFASPEDAISAYEHFILALQEPILVAYDKKDLKYQKVIDKYLKTSAGRLLFNAILPSAMAFVNADMHKKNVRKVVSELIRFVGIEHAQPYLDSIKDLGYQHATKSGLSWGMDDLIIPHDKKAIMNKAKEQVAAIYEEYLNGYLSDTERRSRVIEIWVGVEEKLRADLFASLPQFGPVYTFIKCGAAGNEDNARQIMAIKGLVVDSTGSTIEVPVESCYEEGLTPLEYFNSIHGSRKGLVDTALRTAHAGYLTRRLVDVAQDVVVQEDDCGDVIGRLITHEQSKRAGESFTSHLLGRVAAQDIKHKRKIIVKAGLIIGHEACEHIETSGIDRVRIRAITSCKTRFGVCRKCYGYDMGREKLVETGQAIGVIAAQSIGEPGTQLTLRTFHSGGSATAVDITQGLPRVEEVFELHNPKGKGALAHREGVVEDIVDYGTEKVITIKVLEGLATKKSRTKKKGVDEYVISGMLGVLVKKGDEIKKGQRLSEGNLDIHEILSVLGKRAAEEYIIREVKRIYILAGSDINDKHIEVFARKMFSRVRVTDPGGSKFLPGEIIDRSRFFETNDALRVAKKKPMHGVQTVTGISKVALSAEGFLSAASFQHTSHVLIDSVIEGREDTLRGLKENVIIGKMIPAGTGFRPVVDF